MHNTTPQSATPKRRPKTVGFGFWSVDAAQSIDTIVAAEMAGLEQIWLTQAPTAPDSLTVFAAALTALWLAAGRPDGAERFALVWLNRRSWR